MQKRNRRAGVEDRWHKKDGTPTSNYGIGLRWRARYVDDEGRERARGFATKASGKVWLAGITASQVNGSYVDPGKGQATIGQIYQQWSSARGHVSTKTEVGTHSTWNRHVSIRWERLPVGDVQTSAVRSWVAQMVRDEVGVPTIEKAYGLLSQLLSTAVEDKRVTHNPCIGVSLPKREHADRGYLTHIQVAALAAAASRGAEVVRFLAYTGLRWGEMAALRVQDFDMLRRRVNISRSVTEARGLVWGTPKTWERRSVPFPASLTDELAALMVGKARDELVFTDMRGGVLRNSNYRARVFAPAVEACQMADPTFPTITPHDLRHTAASLAVSAGANVKALQRMLGHAKASMTLDTYADLFDADLDGVADSLDAAIRNTADGLRTG
ncbi:site-specific integrase [Mycobacteroides chelonae]|uniref:tyrosine-type recombinase/integrase n=1 Tax=Mycobacteroides chelonae TaxID=1774 RepID=UPI0008A8F2F3|nr:site-specific integrase [Mycobacteroides chelonae]OHT80483.1 site-specific integrase [Mycobacteroides chelonae]